ncbi:helix-turn-helix domain-containing protein [Actinocatenispora rupis]|uniref:Transcriptional regulator n=1 Tax=Actinocatenispora rupis TaxID=519421 RepID=A0A8J3N835_9ACTN|nr:helix-turn-helix transcriptional regulator [Actinocatenispora rupis]GID09696.1 transcriptional regulator [Actinocatenispora rupis]
MTEAGSTVPRRQLGRQTKALRVAAGYTAEIAADELGWSRHKIWRIETGRVAPTKSDVIALSQLYHADEQTSDLLVTLAGEAKAKNWWHAYGDALPSWFVPFMDLESTASDMRSYDAELVPGLLQTPDYCFAICRASTNDSTEDIEKRVALRMRRQDLLTREEPSAPHVSMILNEAVLRRAVGDRRAMRKQLEHVIECTDLPNVDVRVFPFSMGQHAAMASSFVILEFPDRQDPGVVYLESYIGGLYLDRAKDLTRYNFVMRDLECRALDRLQSRDFIQAAVKEM